MTTHHNNDNFAKVDPKEYPLPEFKYASCKQDMDIRSKLRSSVEMGINERSEKQFYQICNDCWNDKLLLLMPAKYDINPHRFLNLYAYAKKRMGMGALRYGSDMSVYRLKDCTFKASAYIEKYKDELNLECLCDALNYCMMGYVNWYYYSDDVEAYRKKLLDLSYSIHKYWESPIDGSFFEASDDDFHLGEYSQ